jgi:hypothetical protein
MSKIINFNKEEIHEEEHACETCDLVDELMVAVLDSESHEDLYATLFFFVEEAKKLAHKESLVLDIQHKLNILDAIECEDCECDECKLED